jgi:hypothetical protein
VETGFSEGLCVERQSVESVQEKGVRERVRDKKKEHQNCILENVLWGLWAWWKVFISPKAVKRECPCSFDLPTFDRIRLPCTGGATIERRL